MSNAKVTVSDDGRTYLVQPEPIRIVRIDDCIRCGAQLWSRNGTGYYVNTGMLFGAPLLQPHYQPCTTGWDFP